MKNEKIKNTVEKIRKIGSFGIAGAIVICSFLFYNSFIQIPPGAVGVIYNLDGGLEDKVMNQGLNFVLPWKRVTVYPVSTEVVYYQKSDKAENDTSINVNTKDGKQVNVSVTYSFHMDAKLLPNIFTKFRGQNIESIESGYMKNEMFQAINEVTSQYSLMDLIGDKRPEINLKIFNQFKESLAADGIIIENFNLSDIVPDAETKEIIQKVVNAQNVYEQAKIEKQTAEVNAEKARIEAEGKANALLVQSKAQAEANILLNQSLTENILRNKAIEKWDGKSVPQVIGSDKNMLFGIDITK